MKQFEDEELIDLGEMWQAWVKNINIVKKVTLGCVLAAGLALVVIPPTYEATSTIRIKPQKGLGASVLDATSFSQTNQQQINTYLQILQSRSVVDPVKKVINGDYDCTLNMVPVRNTDLVTIGVTSKNAERAQKTNKLLLESFLNKLTELERQQYSTTRQFLEGRVADAKNDLNKAEDTLTKFQKEHKIVSTDSTVAMAAEKLRMTDKLKAENRINMEAANAMAAAVDSQMRNNAKSLADSPVLSGLNKQLAELEAKRVEYAAKYTEKHPSMIKVKQDIEATKTKINQEIDKVVNNQASVKEGLYGNMLGNKLRSEAEASVAASNLQSLENIENEFKNDIDKLSEAGKEHLRLIRDVNLSQEIYTMLAKRLEEAKVAEVSISREVQIVDNAEVPTVPVAPRKGRILALAFLLGFLASSVYAVCKELMNRTIKSGDDIEKYLDIPVLGHIPSMESIQEAKEVSQMSTMKKFWRALWKK